MYNLDENDDFDRELIATYEEVSKLYPRPGVYRPIVLIGAPGVGRNELKRRLVARDSDKYRSPVPCKYFSLDNYAIGNLIQYTFWKQIQHVQCDLVKFLVESIYL